MPALFGTGTHDCLGASLARLEARLTLSRVRQRMGAFPLGAAGLARVRSSTARGFRTPPVAFTPGEA